MEFTKVNYATLNAKQKEIYNFQRVSAIFAELGFGTIKLQDDWEGADFIAIPFKGGEYMRVQLKGRMVIDKKYLDKKLHICFEDKPTKTWYLYPHDEVFNEMAHKFHGEIWTKLGIRSFVKLSKPMRNRLETYKLVR